MQNYIRSIGFSMYKKKNEVKELLDKIQRENIASARISVTTEKERLWEIRKNLSESVGLCIYGYLENLGVFVREGYFPYVKDTSVSSVSKCSIEKHIDDSVFSGMLDDNRLGMSLIFRLSNPLDYDTGKKISSVNLFGFCSDGKVLLPIKKTLVEIESSKQRSQDRTLLIEAAKRGDENAIDTLTTDEALLYSTLNDRIQTEDVYSIVDTLFMPYGMENDIYSIVGNILDIKEEENILTNEKILILKIECSDIELSIAIKKEDLRGEPMVGRRFKGNIWLHGKINQE